MSPVADGQPIGKDHDVGTHGALIVQDVRPHAGVLLEVGFERLTHGAAIDRRLRAVDVFGEVGGEADTHHGVSGYDRSQLKSALHMLDSCDGPVGPGLPSILPVSLIVPDGFNEHLAFDLSTGANHTVGFVSRA